ncbi:CPA2 family monovalent cation proton (H+) antiporter-2 [Lactobacillus kalixensis DSM 16043]|uniref:CPA2 family monovalent cation proton (H+) antiporter-2 n=2 Tax=Lactobacillus kalixensis TaxID=227944 RepID=A0A0R1UE09_9LACO|nr:CPA2 family monovalent cation proton (H+) antiporter-2 [Lactobacillus kalixensis DSM 16043]
MDLLFTIYPQMSRNWLLIIPYGLLMVIICFLLGKITGPYLDNLVGSGVPQVEAALLGENKMNWWQILWRKFVGGLLAICPGLMLGREGPCIQMGAMIGQGYAESAFKVDEDEARTLQEAGVAAGLSAAFSAPLAGAIFLVEEITFNFKPDKIISALIACFSADLVTVFFLGTKPCLYLPVKGYLPLTAYIYLPLIGIVLGLLAYVYQFCLLSLKPIFSKLTIIPAKYHSIIPFLLIIPVGIFNAKLLGGSHVLITTLFNQNLITNTHLGSISLLLMPLLLFLIRYVFSMLSYGSSVPGGIFMPILVLGTLLGVFFANSLIQCNLISSTYFPHIVIISMAAYFGAIEKAPFTAIILVTEMVGTVEQVLPMVITTFVAYYVLDLIGGRPIYEALRIQKGK